MKESAKIYQTGCVDVNAIKRSLHFVWTTRLIQESPSITVFLELQLTVSVFIEGVECVLQCVVELELFVLVVHNLFPSK